MFYGCCSQGILNHCFDDIEQFIAWLQSAASAFRELERRRNQRKNKSKDHGDGLLAMRARPPPERDFVDVFQKFKLSFNLLVSWIFLSYCLMRSRS